MKRELKKVIFIISLILVLALVSGCQSTSIGLRIVEPQPESSNPLRYEDENINLTFKPYTTWKGLEAIVFELENKTDSSIKILWNEVTMVKPDKTASRVIHKGVRFIDRDKSMPSTIVPRGSKLTDNISPTENVSWNSYSSSWEQNAIVKNNKKYHKENLSVLLPLEINGKRKEYQFDFEILIIES